MKNAPRLASLWIVAIAFALVAWVSVSPTDAGAQTGDNAVYSYLSACCASSPAFIDASVFGGSTTNLCGVLYFILSTSYPATGEVIDARGLPFPSSSMTCTGSNTPWYNGSTYLNVPSTILLPAGTIALPVTWQLPSNTHLIGEGDNPIAGGTTLQATSPLTSGSGPLIQFGPTSCSSASTGISVEQLILDGLGNSISGIVNSCAADDSYVDHVSLYRVRGTVPPTPLVAEPCLWRCRRNQGRGIGRQVSSKLGGGG
jgi:hypothetical protein